MGNAGWYALGSIWGSAWTLLLVKGVRWPGFQRKYARVTVSLPLSGAGTKIPAIKVARAHVPAFGLAQAKEFVEGKTATLPIETAKSLATDLNATILGAKVRLVPVRKDD